MSVNNWTVRGVGLCVNKLVPFIDEGKLQNVVQQNFPDKTASGNEEVSYVTDFIDGYGHEDLGKVFCSCDDSGTLVCWGDEDNTYLYYPSAMPWQRKESDPKTPEEVHKIIVNTVQRLCNITEKQIEERFIDDALYATGFDYDD